MKLFDFFLDIFCVLALLIIGSLMIVVALHILPMEDALIQVQAIYESSLESLRLGVTGFLFIVVGLVLSKILVKKTRKDDDFFIIENDAGRFTITYAAVSGLVERALKKFDGIRHSEVDIIHKDGQLIITINTQVLQSFPNGSLEDLVNTLKQEVEARVRKMLKCTIPIIVMVHVTQMVEERPFEVHKSQHENF